jgi:hypothetical protein
VQKLFPQKNYAGFATKQKNVVFTNQKLEKIMGIDCKSAFTF